MPVRRCICAIEIIDGRREERREIERGFERRRWKLSTSTRYNCVPLVESESIKLLVCGAVCCVLHPLMLMC